MEVLRRVVRVLGHPRTLVVCLLVLAYSWALLGMTRVVPFGMVLGGGGQYIPRLEGWDLKPETSARCLLIAPDAAGSLAVVETREGDDGWDAPREQYAFLVLQRVTCREGIWAPVTEQVYYYAHPRHVRWRGERPWHGFSNLLPKLMAAVPAEQRGEWSTLWQPNPPDDNFAQAEVERVLWWGYAWNAVTAAALIGVIVWPFAALFLFVRRCEARHRLARGQCVRCAYQLKTDAATLTTCPECGAAAPPETTAEPLRT